MIIIVIKQSMIINLWQYKLRVLKFILRFKSLQYKRVFFKSRLKIYSNYFLSNKSVSAKNESEIEVNQ